MNPHPHELAPLLVALGRAGVELAPHHAEPAWVRHRRPTPNGWTAVLPPDLSARLRLHRRAVLSLLAGGYAPDAHPGNGDAGYVYGERLGVADGLGMPTHPGSAAWLVAVGESMGCGCRSATDGVHSGHGSTHECHSGGGEGERRNTGSDRKGRGRGP